MKQRINLHIYPSLFTHEARMLKITQSLVDALVFDHVYIFATWEPGLLEEQPLDPKRTVWRIRTKQKLLTRGIVAKGFKMLEWLVRSLWRARKLPVACVNCHSLSVLVFGVTLKHLKKCRLIYDTHELETETGSSRGLRKTLGKRLEKTLMPHVDHVVVVGEAIAQWYRHEYPQARVTVVKNVPSRRTEAATPDSRLRDALKIPAQDMIFLYQGLLSRGRSVELYLNIFANMPLDKHLVFLGFGVLEERVQAAARENPNIHFHPAVPPAEISLYTSGADVGLAVIENISLSYFYSLPNKVFEYLNCGIPMIVSDFPEVGRLIEEHQCGWKVAVEETALACVVQEITHEEIAAKKANALVCRANFSWENEEPHLINVYRELGLAEHLTS